MLEISARSECHCWIGRILKDDFSVGGSLSDFWIFHFERKSRRELNGDRTYHEKFQNVNPSFLIAFLQFSTLHFSMKILVQTDQSTLTHHGISFVQSGRRIPSINHRQHLPIIPLV